MAEILVGDVELKRIAQLLAKVLTHADFPNYKMAVDNLTDDDTKQISLDTLESLLLPDEKAQIVINTLSRPSTEPAISGGTLTIDCESVSGIMFEPRLLVGTRTINASFTHAFSNTTNTNLVSEVYSFTGTITITMDSDVEVSNPSSIGTWDDGLKELTITAGTNDKIEFQYLWDATESIWILKVGEVSL